MLIVVGSVYLLDTWWDPLNFPWISVTFRKGYFPTFKRWKFNQRWFVLSIGGWMPGKSPPILTDEDSLHISSFAWNPISLECWLEVHVIRYSDRAFHIIHLLPPSRTKVQFRRNLNWQFEVDYFGTWNIHFTTISVKCLYVRLEALFSRERFNGDNNICFLASSPISCSRFHSGKCLKLKLKRFNWELKDSCQCLVVWWMS